MDLIICLKTGPTFGCSSLANDDPSTFDEELGSRAAEGKTGTALLQYNSTELL